jgi:hypothetical protein
MLSNLSSNFQSSLSDSLINQCLRWIRKLNWNLTLLEINEIGYSEDTNLNLNGLTFEIIYDQSYINAFKI